MNSKLALTLAAALWTACGIARADIIVTGDSAPPNVLVFDGSNQTTDGTDYEGPFSDGAQAVTFLTIGTFDFTIPTGDTVTGLTISGTFGDVNFSTTALTDLFVDGIKVAECDSFSDPCFAGTVDGSLVPWSYTFTAANLSTLAPELASGSLDFTAVQKSFGSVIVGAPMLDIQVTPEPSTIFTLAGGLLAMLVARRRK
jgi:hypothetical protein